MPKSSPKFLSAAAAAALLTALTYCVPTAAGPSNVPFQATVVTTETIGPTGNASCPLAGMSTGTGTASHLGKILLTATDCVTPDATGFQFAGGKLTFTAANGDTITATYAGSFVASGPGAILSINNAAFQITGGTGRFAGAFGRGELHGTEDVSKVPATGQLQATGTISYPNAAN